MTTAVMNFGIAVDALYGRYTLDPLLRELILQPEIQRLRDVRLSNINSLLLVGSANISRFEHCLGTAHLATVLATRCGLGKRETYTLICAALYHDVGITPFGHLMEEAFQYAGQQFDHERRLQDIFVDSVELGNVDAQIFRGHTAGIRRILNKKELRSHRVTLEAIFAAIDGEGELGPLINGSIDLDNIDNVCRMAWHMGLDFPRSLPMRLVDGFAFDGKAVAYEAQSLPLIQEWLQLRERLYEILMTNPLDFVAKAMLIEAIRLALMDNNGKAPILTAEDWKLTDSELVTRLIQGSSTNELMDRLLRGQLYELMGLFWIQSKAWSATFVPNGIKEIREQIASRLALNPAQVILYVIKDKRTREIKNLRVVGNDNVEPQAITLGQSSPFRLLGVATSVSRTKLGKKVDLVNEVINDVFGHANVTLCDPAAHLERAFKADFGSRLF